MLKRLVPLILSLFGIASACLLAAKVTAPLPVQPPPVEPTRSPYKDGTISGTGMVEAFGDNFAVGSAVSGVVEEVYVAVGQRVKKGDPLFTLDTRELASRVKVNRAQLGLERAKYLRLQDQMRRLHSIEDRRAVSQEELTTKEHDVKVAKRQFFLAAKELALTENLLERQIVRAPKDGTVLQMGIKPGEFISQQSALLLGSLDKQQVRADVDEQNAFRIDLKGAAVAYLKSRPDVKIPLEFKRVEPFVIPKRTLTGQSDERVDTRVLQVIYTFDPPEDFPLYIGSQVQVFIEAKEHS